jgi:hypothetical protein
MTWMLCHGFLDLKALGVSGIAYHLADIASTKSPCGKAAGAASLVVNRLQCSG